MTGNRSLDEFLGGDTGANGGPASPDDERDAADGEPGDEADREAVPVDGRPAAPDEPVAADDEAASKADEPATSSDGVEDSADEASTLEDGVVEASTVEPMAETFAWSAAGGSCDACGVGVETRWRDGDEMVCADCKAW